ncbi:hypothetical protein EON66_03795 [archaeon]|nr:MAG: hypothetical protein EON66_03795 [archaeon]
MQVTYPIIADTSRTLASQLGMLEAVRIFPFANIARRRARVHRSSNCACCTCMRLGGCRMT